MIIDESIINYNRYHIRDIHATIRALSPEQKQKLADEIQVQKAFCSLTERDYNHNDCARIEKLLHKNS